MKLQYREIKIKGKRAGGLPDGGGNAMDYICTNSNNINNTFIHLYIWANSRVLLLGGLGRDFYVFSSSLHTHIHVSIKKKLK